MNLACGILVGGRSRRMGQPKALISIDGMTLLERTVGVAGSVISDVVLIGNPSFELPQSLRHILLIADAPPGCGPIGGLAGFFMARPGSDCLLLACDMPQLDAELLRRLCASDGGEADAVVPRCGNDDNAMHPCCGLYRSSAAKEVFDAVAAKRFAMLGLLDRLRVRWVPLRDSESRWVDNLNTPADAAAFRGTWCDARLEAVE